MVIKTDLLTNVKIGTILVQSQYPCNKSNYAVCTSRDVQYIVIHYTGNTKDTAVNNAKYFQNNYTGTSAHFFVDDTTIQQSVGLKNRAWHCGSKTNASNTCVNQNSIGIEMCTSGNYLVSTKTQNNAIELAAYLCKMLGIDANNVDKYVLRHYDVGTDKKPCPAQFVKDAAQWNTFKANIKKKLTRTINLQQFGSSFANIERIAYVPMGASNGETLTAAAGRVTWNGRHADAMCNGEFFNMSNYKPASGIVSKTNGEANWTDQYGISFVNNILPKISFKNNLNANDWIAGYPLLLDNGKIAIPANFTDVSANSYRARTAIGYDDTRFAMFWVKEEDGCTLQEFAEAIKGRGFKYAINLDGGGSTAGATTMWSYDQGRKTRGKIAMWIKNGTGNKLQKKTTTTTTTATPAVQEGKLLQDRDKSKGVKLTVTATSGLNLRKSAPNGAVFEVLSYNSKVSWYGYYIVYNKQTYYCVLSASGKTGYVAAQYLK